ncbi:hypothetical protein CFIMG_004462RA [Ceratocystis fimbriata CBS 114723]|uniref:Uncharacterized protein n=1 Tax=Ceratocystis fimbriata CBS 114723 TaxID=1035309 RepID=A0A2C5X199_9PEZI|nr:hypothetical protein CFIMG_004462RA [Ceratocystis fimbriata CBS 114723]
MSSRSPEEHEEQHRRRASGGRKSTSASMNTKPHRFRVDYLKDDLDNGNNSAIDSDTDSATDSGHRDVGYRSHRESDPNRSWKSHGHHHPQSHHRKRTTSSTSRTKMTATSSSTDPAYPNPPSHVRAGSKSMHRTPGTLSGLSGSSSNPGPSSSSKKNRTKSSSGRSKGESEPSSSHRRKSTSAKHASTTENSDHVPSARYPSPSRHERHSQRRRRHGSRHEEENAGIESSEDDDQSVVSIGDADTKLDQLNINPEISSESDGEKSNLSGDESKDRPLLTAGHEDEQAKEDAAGHKTNAGNQENGNDYSQDTQPTDTESQPDNENKQLVSVDPDRLEAGIEAATAKEKEAQSKDSYKKSRHRSTRKNSRSVHEPMNFGSDIESGPKPKVPSPPASNLGTNNDTAESDTHGDASDSEAILRNKGHSRKTSNRSNGKSSSRRPTSTSEGYIRPSCMESMTRPVAVPPGATPTSERRRRSRLSTGDWVEYEPSGSIGSDHRGSFSRGSRPSNEFFPRRSSGSGSYENNRERDRSWNPHAGSGNSYMSQSPGNGVAMESDSDDGYANGDHSEQVHPSPHRSSRHRASHSQHSSTPPKPHFRRQSVVDRSRESSGRPSLPIAPEVPSPPQEGFSSRRPHAPTRTVSNSSSHNIEAPSPPLSQSQSSGLNNSDKRRRPSYNGVRPGTSSQQRSNSAIPEESDSELNYIRLRRPSMHDEGSATRPARRGSDRHTRPPLSSMHTTRPPTVPTVPTVHEDTPEVSDGYDEFGINPAATELDGHSDNQDAESSTEFPEDMEMITEDHKFLKTREKLSGLLLQQFHAWCNGGPVRSPLGGRFEGSSSRRARGSFRVEEIQHEAEEGFSGGQSASTRRRSMPSIDPAFACPFTKYNPPQFAGCGGFVLNDMHDVEKHLKWCHRNTISCPRCMKTFASHLARDNHSKEDPPCPARSERRHSGLKPQVRHRIYNIVDEGRGNDFQKYMAVYQVIFPSSELPESPYIDGDILRDLKMFKEWFSRHGEDIIQNYLAKKHLLSSHEGSELEKDLRIFNRTMCENGCYMLYNEWLEGSGNNNAFMQGSESPWTGTNDGSSNGFSPRTPLTAGTSWNSSCPLPQGSSGGVSSAGNGSREGSMRDSGGQYTPTVPSNRRSASGFDERYDHARAAPRRQSISRNMTIPPGPVLSPQAAFGRSGQPGLTPQGPALYMHEDEYMPSPGVNMPGMPGIGNGMGLGMNMNSGPGPYYETLGVFDGMGSLPMGGNLNMNMAAEEYRDNGYFPGRSQHQSRYQR